MDRASGRPPSDPGSGRPASRPAGPARTARGERRRRRLVDAAADLLEQEGFEAISHRAVAARAGLPLAATTYYFRSLDDLIAAALAQLGGSFVARAAELVASYRPGPRTPENVARTVVDLVAGGGEVVDPARLLTVYERYVQAGRHPHLRPVVRAWTDQLAELVGVVLERAGYPAERPLARTLVALVDGLLLDALIEGRHDTPARAAEALSALLRRLAPAT